MLGIISYYKVLIGISLTKKILIDDSFASTLEVFIRRWPLNTILIELFKVTLSPKTFEG